MTIGRIGLQVGLVSLLLAATGCSERQSQQSAESGEKKAGEKADRVLVDEGRRAFRKCATCHCATDPAIAEDEEWLKMNETTACISGGESTPRMRKALNAYLRSDEAIRPVRIDEAYTPKKVLPHGRVLLPGVGGSAFLKADGEQVAQGAPAKIRLYWKAGADNRSLKVPAGTYRVISYALYGKDADATKRWMMTATNVNGCLDVAVETGQDVPLGLHPVLNGVLSVEPADEGTMVRFKQTDLYGNVATVSLNGEPQLPEYVVTDANGKKVHAAVFENT